MEKKKNNATEKVENITEDSSFYHEDEELNTELENLREDRAKAILEQKELKAKQKQDNKKMKEAMKKKNGKPNITGWVAAVIALSCVLLVVSTLFIVSMTDDMGTNKQVEGTTDQAYYDFVNYVDNIDVDLSKLIVSNDKKNQQRILGELTTKSQLATANLSRLPIQDESKFYTTKFINQVGDYSKYLNNKLIDGLSITSEDKENLNSLSQINGVLKSELSNLTTEMGADFDFLSLLDNNNQNIVLSKFDELESNAVDYPKLIYDGPFADSLDKEQAKGLSGGEISLNQAQEKVNEYFADYGISEIQPMGEGVGTISTYNFESKMEGGSKLYCEISKVGGKLIMFECYKDCQNEDLKLDKAEEIGLNFLSKLGFEKMNAVWATEKGAICYMNFVSTVDNMVIYPDMVKITVCKERKLVSSFDAREYYLNHAEDRQIIKPTLSADEARKKVSDNLEIETTRLAVIPYGENNEITAYEFGCDFNGVTYYVYINATTGDEAQIFRVVETTEGQLLL